MEIDMSKFRKRPERARTHSVINNAKLAKYEKELRDIEAFLSGPTNIRDNSLFTPKTLNIADARRRRAEIIKIIENCAPKKLSQVESGKLNQRMRQLESLIREHRPLTKNQMATNPKNHEEVKRLGQIQYDKTQVIQKYEKELQNIRITLYPDNPQAGRLDYLRRR